ncbi:MAG: ABC transporter substrate-binding protein [Kaiparowitsia implicata GSE-PSE-MK54-09C]|jgi:branched-chain amino acid transport system substrate-binding protein|nr:ABC transporter substrate-binding protein [Kaiparowitsia implicata GSE-PSE-MK54-09C]
MAQKNETPALILSLLVTLALIGAGFWWFGRQMGIGILIPTGGSEQPSDRPSSGGGTTATLGERFSVGDRLLVSAGATPDKQAGIEAIASGNYAQAIERLQASLQQQRNDPEALIYLNNARIGDDASYSVAVAVPLGASVNSALELMRGAAHAQDRINAVGGINGTPIKIALVDDNNDPETAADVARRLVDDSTVLAVVGHFGSDTTLAAAAVYNEGNLPMISPTSTSVQLSGQGPYIFRTVPNDRFTATTLSRFMVEDRQQRNAAVFFNSESGYSLSLKNEFTTAVASDGGQVLMEFDLAAPGFDAGSAVNQARQQGVEVLVLAANTATLDPALQVIAVNRQELTVLGGDSLYNPKVLQVGGANAEGLVVAVPWIIQSAPQSSFAQESRQLWGGDVNWRTAMTYDALESIGQALAQSPTRDGIAQTMRSGVFSVEGATGTVRFLPSGDRNQAMQLVEVLPGDRSGYGYDFSPAQ